MKLIHLRTVEREGESGWIWSVSAGTLPYGGHFYLSTASAPNNDENHTAAMHGLCFLSSVWFTSLALLLVFATLLCVSDLFFEGFKSGSLVVFSPFLSSLQWTFPSQMRHSLLGNSLACKNPELSCQSGREDQDTCCFNYPGGLFLQTQFWDAHPATGPADWWTVHGLWPDRCDGSFDQYCDDVRAYDNISLIISGFGRNDLLLDMRSYWKDYQGADENLWKHEWNKHGTCISTLETRCFENYSPQQDVLAYFDRTMELFKELNSYKFLSGAGIRPSLETTYDLDDIKAALRIGHNRDVIVHCRGGCLSEIWYYFNVVGSVKSGKFEPTDPDAIKSNCPQHGIKYPPKVNPNPPNPTTSKDSGASPTGEPFAGQGNLDVITNGRRSGCIISRGTWYKSGTFAIFNVVAASPDIDIRAADRNDFFTLASSKGSCTFENDVLTCDSRVKSSSTFSSKGNKLSLNGSTIFFADVEPKGWHQEKIYDIERPTSLEIVWRPL